MLLSKNLLQTVAPGLKQFDQDALLKAFDSVGIEVENIIQMPHIDGLAFGLVKDVQPHPSWPTLHVCQVEINGKDWQIECGASNVAPNHTVVVATVGTHLPTKGEIKVKDVSGILSHGMFCSYQEINPEWATYLSKEENQSIILLPPEIYHTHQNVDQVLGLDDTVFDLFLQTNRNDLNGVILIANELKAVLHSNFVFEDITLRDILDANHVKIQIQSPDVLSFNWFELTLNTPYTTTNWFWKRFLINSGIHVTNTIVDLANFLTLLTANPVHFYDKNRLDLANVKVVNLDHELEFTGLDHHEYMLQSGDLVVMAGGELVSLPGIMGGRTAMITNKTRQIIVEIGTFKGQRIQATAKRLKLQTVASERFSRLLSSNLPGLTWMVAQNLILKEFAHDFHVLFTMNTWKQGVVAVDVDTLNKILGTKMTTIDITEILSRTGFKYVNGQVSVPSHRTDVHDAQDVAEEIMKSININDFKPQQIVAPALLHHGESPFDRLQRLRQLLLGKQISEVKTYNLTSEADANKFNWFKITDLIRLQNPLSNQREVFRTTMVPQLLGVLRDNLNRKEALQNIFEIQKIHHGFQSFDCLTVVLSAPLYRNPLDGGMLPNDFLLVKNLWECLAQEFQLPFILQPSQVPEGFPEQTVAIQVAGATIGFLSQLRPQVLHPYGLQNVNVMVLKIDSLLQSEEQRELFQPVSELHPVFRNLTFLVPDGFQLGPLVQDLKQIWTEVTLVDKFVKDHTTSYTLELKYVPHDHTPDGEEINIIYQKALQKLSEHHLTLK